MKFTTGLGEGFYFSDAGLVIAGRAFVLNPYRYTRVLYITWKVN
jgi:hypothetical protein